MTIEKTMFGRHYAYDYVKHARRMSNERVMFSVDAPRNGYIINGTVKQFGYDALQYMYIQQLNSCDACIVTTSCVHSVGHFNSTMRLVSYDTLICEATFLSENIRDDKKPYVRFTIGEHWNYSRTTVQHLYKFLRMFGFNNVCINDIAKRDKKDGNGSYTYQLFTITNNVDKIGEICFTSSDAFTDFALNNAQHFVDRMIKSNQ